MSYVTIGTLFVYVMIICVYDTSVLLCSSSLLCVYNAEIKL